MRPRLHVNNAERQKAYRARVRDGEVVTAGGSAAVETRAILAKGERKLTRPARIQWLAGAVEDLADEYRTWRDAIPDNLSGGPLAEQVDDTVTKLEEAASLLQDIEPPRVGRA